jgi:hypothetical protein
MSKPARCALRAASACQLSNCRMSQASITRGRWLPMKFTWVAIQAVPEGDIGGMRLARFITEPPPCHSSIPASAPSLWTASVMSACERTSSSSQSVA